MTSDSNNYYSTGQLNLFNAEGDGPTTVYRFEVNSSEAKIDEKYDIFDKPQWYLDYLNNEPLHNHFFWCPQWHLDYLNEHKESIKCWLVKHYNKIIRLEDLPDSIARFEVHALTNDGLIGADFHKNKGVRRGRAAQAFNYSEIVF